MNKHALFTALGFCTLLVASGSMAADMPRIKLKTNMGVIVMELDPTKAPKTVENFIHYVQEGHYDGTIFHRVIPGFMIQGGGFTTDYKQKPTHDPISNEANNGLQNRRGTVAMARTSDPQSATAQFFINVVDNSFLDFTTPDVRGWGYAVFGTVVEGMDVVDKIANVPTGAAGPFAKDVPRQAVIIEKATLENAASITH